jgi:hypothetical protein
VSISLPKVLGLGNVSLVLERCEFDCLLADAGRADLEAPISDIKFGHELIDSDERTLDIRDLRETGELGGSIGVGGWEGVMVGEGEMSIISKEEFPDSGSMGNGRDIDGKVRFLGEFEPFRGDPPSVVDGEGDLELDRRIVLVRNRKPGTRLRDDEVPEEEEEDGISRFPRRERLCNLLLLLSSARAAVMSAALGEPPGRWGLLSPSCLPVDPASLEAVGSVLSWGVEAPWPIWGGYKVDAACGVEESSEKPLRDVVDSSLVKETEGGAMGGARGCKGDGKLQELPWAMQGRTECCE